MTSTQAVSRAGGEIGSPHKNHPADPVTPERLEACVQEKLPGAGVADADDDLSEEDD